MSTPRPLLHCSKEDIDTARKMANGIDPVTLSLERFFKERCTLIVDQVRTQSHGEWLLGMSAWINLRRWKEGTLRGPFVFCLYPYAGSRLPLGWKEREVPS